MTRARSRTAIAIASRLPPTSPELFPPPHHPAAKPPQPARPPRARLPQQTRTSPAPEPNLTPPATNQRNQAHQKNHTPHQWPTKTPPRPPHSNARPTSRSSSSRRRSARCCRTTGGRPTTARRVGLWVRPSAFPLAQLLPPNHDHRQPANRSFYNPGASAFIGLGVYSYISGHSQLREQRARQLAEKSLLGLRARKASITGLAGVLVGLGVYRLVN